MEFVTRAKLQPIGSWIRPIPSGEDRVRRVAMEVCVQTRRLRFTLHMRCLGWAGPRGLCRQSRPFDRPQAVAERPRCAVPLSGKRASTPLPDSDSLQTLAGRRSSGPINVHEWLPQTIPAMKPCLAAAEDRQVSRDTHQILCGERRLGDHDRLHGLLGERDRTTAFQENRKKRTRLDLFWRHAILERPFHSASAIG